MYLPVSKRRKRGEMGAAGGEREGGWSKEEERNTLLENNVLKRKKKTDTQRESGSRAEWRRVETNANLLSPISSVYVIAD
jgi:hypothetical protein